MERAVCGVSFLGCDILYSNVYPCGNISRHRYFALDGEPKPKTFTITVTHAKSLSADEVLGKAVIPFSASVDAWFPLEGERAQGELRVILRFYNSEVTP